MSSEITRHLCRTKFGVSRAVGEEEDRQVSPGKLDAARAELPFVGEPEPATIELDPASQISDLDIGVDSEQGRPLRLGAKLANRLDHRLGGFTRKEVPRDRHYPSLIRAGKEAVVAFR